MPGPTVAQAVVPPPGFCILREHQPPGEGAEAEGDRRGPAHLGLQHNFPAEGPLADIQFPGEGDSAADSWVGGEHLPPEALLHRASPSLPGAGLPGQGGKAPPPLPLSPRHP